MSGVMQEVVNTRMGPVDIRSVGEGPAVLAFHGAPGGSDQGRMVDSLVDGGYRVITFSRPGYLDTPLSSGATFDAQGDLAASLLDTLAIDRAAALGMSAGGPAALAFVTRHPDRAWALVLEAAVTDAYEPADLAQNHLLGRLILSPVLGGPTFWWLHRSMVRRPERAAEQMLQIESTLDAERRKRCARAIAEDREPWIVLAESMVPFRRRRAGLRNDLEQLARVDVHAWTSLRLPTLLQYSATDADVPMEHAHRLVELGVPAELVIHDDACGHLIWFGPTARAVAEKRLAFLERHRIDA